MLERRENMELQQLKYFQVVAKLEHMTQAAKELYIAQPSLSKAIARLEEEVGAPLFDRQGRQIRLNQSGRTFLARVERAFAEIEEGQREVADLVGLERGLIGLAVLYTVGANILPNLLHAFRTEHPHIRFRLFQNAAQVMLNQLDAREIDLCITSPAPENQEIDWAPLMTEEIFLAVPPGHPLASRSSICLSEVAHEPFVSLKPQHGLRQTTDEYCRQVGFKPEVTFEGDELTLVRGLVAAGIGVAFIPALAWQQETEHMPVRLHIEEPRCQRTIGLAWIRDRYLTSAAHLFRQFVVQYFAHLQQAE
jgi:DNA-binding transcriptional LysR family regulator